MDLAERVEQLIAPTVEGLGFEIVRIQISGKHDLCLQVMAEPRDGKTMTVDDCADISRAVSAVLDVEDPIDRTYTLEVSSPGLDRPLVKPRDFERFAGFEAKIEAYQPIEDRRRFRGHLAGMENGSVKIIVDDGQEKTIAFDNIQKAKLVLTDELIAAAKKR